MSVEGLGLGTWQPRPGGVYEFVPFAPPPVVERKAYDLRKLIACPTCRASVVQSCRVVNGATKGRRREHHKLRLTPRLCRCGSSLGAQRQLCEPCRVEMLRESKREYMRRVRAQRQAAA